MFHSHSTIVFAASLKMGTIDGEHQRKFDVAIAIAQCEWLLKVYDSCSHLKTLVMDISCTSTTFSTKKMDQRPVPKLAPTVKPKKHQYFNIS